jgi:hypothetical protein
MALLPEDRTATDLYVRCRAICCLRCVSSNIAADCLAIVVVTQEFGK